LAQDEAELKIPVLCRTTVYHTIEKDVIISAEEVEEVMGPEAGIYIYYVQPDDTLWSIAKKYNTTISGILKYNAIGGRCPDSWLQAAHL
jgi:LysM repeat protein